MTTTKSKVVYNPVFTDGAEFRIPTFKLLKQDGSLYKGAKAPELDKDKALRIYRAMVTTRIFFSTISSVASATLIQPRSPLHCW